MPLRALRAPATWGCWRGGVSLPVESARSATEPYMRANGPLWSVTEVYPQITFSVQGIGRSLR